jgi:hypothetical protein
MDTRNGANTSPRRFEPLGAAPFLNPVMFFEPCEWLFGIEPRDLDQCQTLGCKSQFDRGGIGAR